MNENNFELYEIQFMEDSISNSYQDQFLLENVYNLISGDYLQSPLKLWQSLNPEAPGIWTLNTEELCIAKLASNYRSFNLQLEWVQPKEVIDNAWKMTTTTNGKEIKLKIHLDTQTTKFIHPAEAKSKREETWTIKQIDGSNLFGLFDESKSQISLEKLKTFIPQSNYRKIVELNPDELADYAFKIFVLTGKNIMMARLIYRCLELDSNHPLGLRCLTDFLDRRGTEALSSVVLEYIIENNIPKTATSLNEHKTLLFRSKYFWGFSKHKNGNTNLGLDDFENRDQFIVNDQAYEDFINEAITAAGSKIEVINGAHNIIGLIGEVMFSPSIIGNHTSIEMLGFSDFEKLDAYDNFLQESTKKLEEVERKFQQMK